jgi:hypothetical protein
MCTFLCIDFLVYRRFHYSGPHTYIHILVHMRFSVYLCYIAVPNKERARAIKERARALSLLFRGVHNSLLEKRIR